jgi:hemoglobin
MTMSPPRLLSITLLCCAALAAAASSTLYARLGGQGGVTEIADTLIDRAAHDPLLGRSFSGSNLERIKKLLAEQLCDLSGGPCRYSGDPMKEVHAGHHISEAEFYRMVETLQAVLKERHVDLRSRNQLLRLLAPTKRDIVEAERSTGRPQTAVQ